MNIQENPSKVVLISWGVPLLLLSLPCGLVGSKAKANEQVEPATISYIG